MKTFGITAAAAISGGKPRTRSHWNSFMVGGGVEVAVEWDVRLERRHDATGVLAPCVRRPAFLLSRCKCFVAAQTAAKAISAEKPRGARFANRTSPPHAATPERTIASPRPAPPASRVRAPSGR